MKCFLLSIILSTCTLLSAQIGRPYAIWEDQTVNAYKFVQLNTSTASMTEINTIPNLLGFVAGDVTAIDTRNNYYHFRGLASGGIYKFYTIDLVTGSVVYSPTITENIVGLKYNCADSTLYGIRETVTNYYEMVSLDPATGISTLLFTIGTLNGYVGGSFAFNTLNGDYTFKCFVGSTAYLKTYNIYTQNAIADVVFPDNVIGLDYSCASNGIYGLWEDGTNYKLELVDPYSGTHSTVSILSNVTPGFISESAVINANNYYSFRGFDGSNAFSLFTIDLSNGSITSSSLSTDNAIGFEETICCNGLPNNIKDLTSATAFSLYPNPCVDVLNIKSNETIKQITILNAIGQSVYRNSTLYTSTIALPIHFLLNGVYSIIISSEKHISNLNFIKE